MSVLEFLRIRFFGTTDRSLTSFSTLISILGTGVSVYLAVRGGEPVPEYIVTRDVIVMMSLVALVIALLFRYVQREMELRSIIEAIANQFRNFHSMLHAYRDVVFGANYERLQPRGLTGQEQRMFNDICDHISEGINDAMHEYFRSRGIHIRDDLHIAVKLLMTSEQVEQILKLPQVALNSLRPGTRFLVTYYRDHNTRLRFGDREILGTVYDVRLNTAAHHIIEARENVYYNNDLQALGNNYHNENTAWRRFYNAKMWLPIRYIDRNNPDRYICYGLLSVDSLNRSRLQLFDDKECREILGHAADLLATFFLLLNVQRPGAAIQGVEQTAAADIREGEGDG